MPLLDAFLLGSALVLACAVRVVLPLRGRDAVGGIGPRARQPRPDPFTYPFGDMPTIDTSFGGIAVSPDADGGRGIIPSGLASVSPSPGDRR